MVTIWKEQQECWGPTIADAIQEGIDKLTIYQNRLEHVPAYTIAMCKLCNILIIHSIIILIDLYSQVLNPLMKLKYIPSDQHDNAIRLLRHTV